MATEMSFLNTPPEMYFPSTNFISASLLVRSSIIDHLFNLVSYLRLKTWRTVIINY